MKSLVVVITKFDFSDLVIEAITGPLIPLSKKALLSEFRRVSGEKLLLFPFDWVKIIRRIDLSTGLGFGIVTVELVIVAIVALFDFFPTIVHS